MELLAIIGTALLCLIGLQFTREKEITRISWSKVSEFVGFMVFVSVIRIALYSAEMDFGIIREIPKIPGEISGSRWALSLVFWEDVFFGMSLYFIHKYIKGRWSNYIKWTLTVLISSIFAYGHAYQGLLTVMIVSIYPYYISKRFGEKHGFGTVMVCHILYDNITFFTMWLLPYFL